MILKLDRPAPQVLRLLINRPEKRNAIDYDVRQALIEALRAVPEDEACRAIVLGGVGGVFSAGGDLPSMVGLSEAQARARLQHIHSLCRLVAQCRLPVVTALEGFGAGAAVGLALLGDHIVVGTGSKILFPFIRLGLAPDWGILRTLPPRVGLPVARRILRSGEIIDAKAAVQMGLADEYADDGDIMKAAIDRAAALSKLPLDAFARMKVRLQRPAATLDEELQREENDQVVLLTSPDFREGYTAFTEKRDPDFLNLGGAAS